MLKETVMYCFACGRTTRRELYKPRPKCKHCRSKHLARPGQVRAATKALLAKGTT